MTLAAERWPAFAGQAAGRESSGALTVYRMELSKLSRMIRVRVIAVCAIVGPFLAVAALHLQNATPGDTAFGQWVHTSGFAIPMVVLGFAAQWIAPGLSAVVAGDIFSSEDHFGTWKTVLTRSRTRGQLFAGKFLAALTFALALALLLTATDFVAGLVAGTQPVVGLGGQLVPAGHAAQLEVLSYLSDIPPLLGFTALAMMLSVVSRSSVVGIGGVIAITFLLQIVALLSLPAWTQLTLLSAPFQAWHGFWEQPAFYAEFGWGLVTCAGWFIVCSAIAWLVFRRRTIGGAS
jgi:ABC-2 type transport system permease protein